MATKTDHCMLPTITNLGRGETIPNCVQAGELRESPCSHSPCGTTCQEVKEICSSADCRRAAEAHCKQCQRFLCNRCREETCKVGSGRHNSVSISQAAKNQREKMLQWKASKEAEIDLINSKVAGITSGVKSHGESLAKGGQTSGALCNLISSVIPSLSEAQFSLQKLLEDLRREGENLRSIDVLKGDPVSDVDVIKLSYQLQLWENKRKVILGDYTPILKDNEYYDVFWDSSSDNLLLAGKGSVVIVSTLSWEIVSTVELKGQNAFSIATCNGQILVGVTDINESSVITSKAEVITLDYEYRIARRWPAPKFAMDMTAVDGKIFVSGSDSLYNENIKVFTLDGKPLPDILWNGKVTGIAAMGTDTIVFSDPNQHKVYKQKVTTGKRCTLWSRDVKRPFSLYVAANDVLWIRSNVNDCFTLLDKEGNFQQEITDDRITALAEIYGFCVHEDHLYVTHGNGMGRFPLSNQ